ncbi:hypothetical protein [Streptomyces sp. GbtcB7]|uniref:hypothetical protein n=1 Tax=Streptomyces sp. GbtcB7 TaxID=2824752 RepID=UPI001C2FFC3B|nr:hypothetical protein [Streptomyces sp. GbtcB7]
MVPTGPLATEAVRAEVIATVTSDTGAVAAVTLAAEAVAAVTFAAHAGPVDELAAVTADTEALAPVTLVAHAGAVAEDTLTGDAVATGTFATDGVAGGGCGVETFASGARHMTILSRFAGRTLCSDFAAAVRRASRVEPLVLNPLGRRGHWHGPATGIP